MMEITAVPDAPDYVEGVINLRGRIIPVIDLRKRFREPGIAADKRNRILVAELEGRLVGLIVDAASEVLKIARGEIEPPPETVAGKRFELRDGTGKASRQAHHPGGRGKDTEPRRTGPSERTHRLAADGRCLAKGLPWTRHCYGECFRPNRADRTGTEVTAKPDLPGMRHVFRRTPRTLPA